jgi:CheY-like chemotaxis protein
MADPARILVVDDEPAVQSALSRAFALEDYDVFQAMDGREALERLGEAGSKSAGDCAKAATARPS